MSSSEIGQIRMPRRLLQRLVHAIVKVGEAALGREADHVVENGGDVQSAEGARVGIRRSVRVGAPLSEESSDERHGLWKRYHASEEHDATTKRKPAARYAQPASWCRVV